MLIGTTSSGQSWPGSNYKEGVFHSPKVYRAGSSTSDAVSYIGYVKK